MSELQVQTRTGSTTTLTDSVLDAFRANLRGQLVLPGEADYAERRRLWNGMIDRHPAMIVCCAGTADVIASVNLAREHDLLLAVRGGGHNVAGSASCDGGMVIDLSAMRSVWVDPDIPVARVEGGATLGDLDHETQAFGLAAPLGVVSRTGVAGLTLGGGYGWLTRKYGLSCDNLLSVDIVTADGQLRRASPTEHPDLLWAVRGGGGNFGVVTSFEFRLHPVGPEVMLLATFYPLSVAREGLRAFREYMATAPEELFALAVLWRCPEGPMFPEEMQGQNVLVLVGVYSGPIEQGEQAIRPLREFDTPIADLSGPVPWVEAQRFFDADYPDGRLYYWKSIYLDQLSDEAIEVLVEQTLERPSADSSVDVWYLGGAYSRVGADETAIGRRDAEVMIGLEANWSEPEHSDANIQWARDAHARLHPFSSGGSYVNFGGYAEDSEEVVRDVYERNLERLAEVKRRYDPTNLFRVNHNIRPGAG
ncbi:MAG: FAD-binding oxidoreductase [Anaerolineae bacterium]